MPAAEPTTPKVRAEGVVFGYDSRPVLHNLTLDVRRGEVLSLLGPNGSGKTTLLKVLLGLYRPRSGRVLLEGEPVEAMDPRRLAKRIAYVPQVHRLSFAYSAFDVVLMGRAPYMSLFSRYSREDRDAAEAAMERLGIARLRERAYTDISGGERQLVLIGRALAQGADTLVMDEPLNGLDYGNQIMLLETIARLAEQGYTFVKSTHFPDHALWIADRVALLREGRLVAEGEPGEVMSEENISELYRTGIAIVDVAGGVRACLPRSILAREAETRAAETRAAATGETRTTGAMQ
jgi:iron complex transport system ATP-binding protein